MASQPESVRCTPFGPFEFDEHSGQLRKLGNVQRLSGKPLQILSLSVSRPGQIIGRDELRRHVWGGTSFGDFEQGLILLLINSVRPGRFGRTIALRRDGAGSRVRLRCSRPTRFRESSSRNGSPSFPTCRATSEAAQEAGIGGWPGRLAVYFSFC